MPESLCEGADITRHTAPQPSVRRGHPSRSAATALSHPAPRSPHTHRHTHTPCAPPRMAARAKLRPGARRMRLRVCDCPRRTRPAEPAQRPAQRHRTAQDWHGFGWNPAHFTPKKGQNLCWFFSSPSRRESGRDYEQSVLLELQTPGPGTCRSGSRIPRLFSLNPVVSPPQCIALSTGLIL